MKHAMESTQNQVVAMAVLTQDFETGGQTYTEHPLLNVLMVNKNGDKNILSLSAILNPETVQGLIQALSELVKVSSEIKLDSKTVN